MKGVILAGGTGSRLLPLTKIMNKSMLPLGRRTIIDHVIDVFIKAGITNIMLISGPEHFGMLAQHLGSGVERACSFTYRVQEKPDGIAGALAMCEDFVGNDKFAVILGDNIFENTEIVGDIITTFECRNDEYGLVVKEVSDPERFGVVRYPTSSTDVMSIIEKPTVPPSNDAVLGLYMYKPNVFDIIKQLRPSARGEYEISDVNNELVQTCKGRLYKIDCGWVDAGTHESYERAVEMLRKKNV
jgi:glucose-1-phosphate thymidylyltransferase